MAKPKRSGGGFQASRPGAPSGGRGDTIPSDAASREEQAAALLAQGRIEEAATLYQALIRAGSTRAVVFRNLAAIHGNLGRHGERIALLRRALQLNPDEPEAHTALGEALRQQGDIQAAIDCFRRAIALRADDPDTHDHLGTALRQLGDPAGAIASYSRSLTLRPNNPDVLSRLGRAQRQLGDRGAAIAAFSRALALRPDDPETLKIRGASLQEQGDLNAAVDSYRRALALRPDDPDLHNNLGAALQELQDPAAAIAAYRTSLQLRPDHPDAHNNLGVALREQGDPAGALACFKAALALKPDDPITLNNLGVAHQELGDPAAAITACSRALKLKPDDAETHWNLGLARLLAGDYSEGWRHYDWRSRRPRSAIHPHAVPRCPPWQGEPIDPRRPLLLISEQGLGDTLQFMRYARALQARGIAVRLCAQPQLHPLIRSSGLDPAPLSPAQAAEVRDGPWLPLLSLPGRLNVSPTEVLISEPYLRPRPELRDSWRDLLAKEPRPIIAINWQGNPKTERAGLSGRSLPLAAFEPIAGLGQGSLLSLQKGFGSEQLERCGFRDRFVSCQGLVEASWDFEETAAIIANCDLVISSDTAVAHLAGGLGAATWLLLHHVPDWRWGLNGERTFWYPSMRLFRQAQRGDWEGVISGVVNAMNART